MGSIPARLLIIVAISLAVSWAVVLVYFAYAQREAIQFRSISWAQGSNHSTRDNLIINDQTTWVSVWGEIAGNNPFNPLPQVNFGNTTLIAAFAGTEPSAGYAVNVTSITKTSTHVEVQITLVVPGQNCIEAEMLTSPYHIVIVPKISLPVEFRTQTSTTSC